MRRSSMLLAATAWAACTPTGNQPVQDMALPDAGTAIAPMLMAKPSGSIVEV